MSAHTAPAAPVTVNLAVLDDIKSYGGTIRYNADGDMRVEYPAGLDEVRARDILAELHG